MMQPFHSHAWLNNENMCHYDVNMMYSTYVKPFLSEDKHLMGFCNNFRYLNVFTTDFSDILNSGPRKLGN